MALISLTSTYLGQLDLIVLKHLIVGVEAQEKVGSFIITSAFRIQATHLNLDEFEVPYGVFYHFLTQATQSI